MSQPQDKPDEQPPSTSTNPPDLQQQPAPIIIDHTENVQYIPFNPSDHKLPPEFSLTRYGDTRDKGSKPNHHELQTLLSSLMDQQQVKVNAPLTILSEETTIIKLAGTNFLLLEATNFLSPIMNEPYYLGKIAFLSVMSGIFAVGIAECTTHRMILCLSDKMSQNERNTIMPMITQGYLDAAKMANITLQGIRVTSGPAFLIGGTATSIILSEQLMRRDCARPGDVLVLTKPIGTSVALKLTQWMEIPEKRARILYMMTENDVNIAKFRALDNMLRSNQISAIAMRRFNTHAACDIESYGLLGHADILVKRQIQQVSFIINNLPIISGMKFAAQAMGLEHQLLHGTLPEISGGLFLAMPKEQAINYIQMLKETENKAAWIIGLVENGDRSVKINDNPRIISVPEPPVDFSTIHL